MAAVVVKAEAAGGVDGDGARRSEARRNNAVGDAKVSFITNCTTRCMRTTQRASVLSACVQRVTGAVHQGRTHNNGSRRGSAVVH